MVDDELIVDTMSNKDDDGSIQYNVELISINMHTKEEQSIQSTISNKQGDSVEDDDSKENYDMDEVEEEEEEDETEEKALKKELLNGNTNEECNANDGDGGEGDDFDECDETKKLVSVKHSDNNDLEDCDYYSDGDSVNEEREEILKYNIGDGIIANLFVGLYFMIFFSMFLLLYVHRHSSVISLFNSFHLLTCLYTFFVDYIIKFLLIGCSFSMQLQITNIPSLNMNIWKRLCVKNIQSVASQ